ncbi:GtrA family protein [Radiobacillus kanasensis]|uniref:GtrA family protein n=1 Tax=Radiobacillus kanasensis TaxID=2844358 RepID=UPI001E373C14|nr:GtrA family protein [Radiobacillus kanasensis]UFT99743.1 GtrA family protein [Radiobacillus kanasensis]
MKFRLFTRFMAVGVVNTIVGVSFMYGLYYLGLSYWVATCIGNGLGACVSYGLNRSFTFRSDKPVKQSILPFFLVIGICYVLAYSISIGLVTELLSVVNLFSVNRVEDIAIIVGAGIYTLLNFVGQKRFVFSK